MNDVELLKKRAAIVRAVRRFFDERGFTEVETAVRIPAPAPEEHIDCPPCGGDFLRASPELQMKKLLADGFERIYQIGPCFREGEKGTRHNPEFTMLEWYRRNATYLDIAADLTSLISDLLNLSTSQPPNLSTSQLPNLSTSQPPNLSTSQPPNFSTSQPLNLSTLTVRDAYREYAGWDPWTDWDQDRFDFDMATKVEPAVKALGGGVFLTDYPPAAASLSKLREGAGGCVAERWEFYWDGLELANCFTELCDSGEQRRRFELAKANRKALGEADYPLDSAFLGCIDRIGSAAGVALGIDRLVMVLLNSPNISATRAEI